MFNDYFGPPVKPFKEAVIPGTTLSEQLIHPLNRMNGFLTMGIAFRLEYMTLDQIADVIEHQQGGCTDPPINLGDEQSLYARTCDNGKATELVRICPHLGGDPKPHLYSIEYMVHKIIHSQTY